MATGRDERATEGGGVSAPMWLAFVAMAVALAVSLGGGTEAPVTDLKRSLGAPVETSVLPGIG